MANLIDRYSLCKSSLARIVRSATAKIFLWTLIYDLKLGNLNSGDIAVLPAIFRNWQSYLFDISTEREVREMQDERQLHPNFSKEGNFWSRERPLKFYPREFPACGEFVNMSWFGTISIVLRRRVIFPPAATHAHQWWSSMVVDGSLFLTLPDLLMQGLLINKFGPAIGRDVIFDVPGEILIIICETAVIFIGSMHNSM